jgi:prefoldin subunit 2
MSLTTPSRLVLDTLTPLPTSRKCFRMINGVLVERTVGDVLPQLQSNADNMNKVLVELAKQYKTKQDDMEKWKVRLDVFPASSLTPGVETKESCS